MIDRRHCSAGSRRAAFSSATGRSVHCSCAAPSTASPACSSPADLIALACRDDVESRVVIRRARHWEVQHGPFEPRFFRRLPARGWTLLVQDVNHFLPQGRELLQRFAFIPYSRLDDLMVSYAPPGGGVGPHFDSYDVFLLQGLGRRRWRISNQRDLTLVADAPLKLLADFRARQEWTLDAGDMLYLPPAWAHDGVAAGRLHDLFHRLPRAGLAGACRASFSRTCRTSSRCAAATQIRPLQPAARPARLSQALLRRYHRALRPHPLVAGRRGALPRLASDRAQAARVLPCRRAGPCPCMRSRCARCAAGSHWS